MDASKEGLIQRLLKEGKITQDDAYLLRKEESKEINIPAQIIPSRIPSTFPPIKKFDRNDWMTREMERRQQIADNCGCNPANGGSGICGCTLTGPIISY